MFSVGEALIGKGNEVAHIDLLIGDKSGPVGIAFANGLAQLSEGHTPLLAVIAPNLPPKPSTLIVPKVTVKKMEQVSLIFGPAQAAVAKAVADSVDEGIIPIDKIDDWVIICSVFIHPKAKDGRKIYHYNYGATKLAIRRALSKYPPLEKIMKEKDLSIHPTMEFRVRRLWRPPYLQVALDDPNLERVKQVVRDLPYSDRLILEVGTTLIKKYGLKVISELRELKKDAYIMADLKTLDVGRVEVQLANEETADAVVISGLAPVETINKAILEANKCGIYSVIDTLNVKDIKELITSLDEAPDVICLHRAIDTEGRAVHQWHLINELKELVPKKLLIGVAGGIRPENTKEALKAGADIIIVGRYITKTKDTREASRLFLSVLGEDEDIGRWTQEIDY